MRFPKLELDVDKYMHDISDLLVSEECHLFIDTNIISQLYKLNDDARSDFYAWVSTVSNRFHIPNWAVHEYQKRYVGQRTKEYLTELENGDVVKRLKSLSYFVKGFISDSLLVGSLYQGKKAELFEELDEVADKFDKIHNAITKRLAEHQLNVHAGILSNLQSYTLSSDLYAVVKSISRDGNLRFEHLLPPGFEDAGKDSNQFGDLIIWRELLSYCKDNGVTKAILITRDAKSDMVYTPQNQTSCGRPVSDGKLAIAHESLVYEFSQAIGQSTEDFYVINFMTLVKSLAPHYQNLAKSFQIVTAPEEDQEENAFMGDGEELVAQIEEYRGPHNTIKEEESAAQLYSQRAMADKDCEEWCDDTQVKLLITKLKSHNWYTQNEAINSLSKMDQPVDTETVSGRDMVFVLGRNIYQSAVGSAYAAIDCLRNLKAFIHDWTLSAQKALVDGMLFEVFFNSKGEIRHGQFKAFYLEELVEQIDSLELESAYQFINSKLKEKSVNRFVPEVHSDKEYEFEFTFESIDKDGNAYTKSLSINGTDVSPSFDQVFTYLFAQREELEEKLALYYAIPKKSIIVKNLETSAKRVFFIGDVL